MSAIQEERQSPSKLAAVLKDLEEKTQQGMASINEHNQKLKEAMETVLLFPFFPSSLLFFNFLFLITSN